MIAPVPPETVLPIEQLKTNEQASIHELVGDRCQIHRLAEMGLRAGAAIRMLRPGTPCLLAVEGKRLSIRLGSHVDVLVATT